MNAVWLMVRKDLRRLAAPVACWLAFQAGGLVWFAQAPGFLPDDPNTWRFGLGLWVELSAWVQFLFGALLTGVLVLEDPVRGSDVFWRTRPISGARLLAAKATAAGLLLVLAPVLVLGVVWAGLGFERGELTQAAVLFLQSSIPCVLTGMAAACLARTLAQHLAALAGVLALQFGLQWLGLYLSPVGAGSFEAPSWLRSVPALSVAYLVPLAVVLAGYLRLRRPVAGVALGAAAALAVVSPRFATGRDAAEPGGFADQRPVPAAGTDVQPRRIHARPQEAVPLTSERDRRAPRLEIVVRQPDQPDALLRPAGGRGILRWSGGPALPVVLAPEVTVPAEAVQAVLSGQRRPEIVWTLSARRQGGGEVRTGSGPVDWTGRIELQTYRSRELGRMPLRPGAQFAHGANRVRIAAVQVPDQPWRPFHVVLEERDSFVSDDETRGPRNRVSLARRTGKVDFFVLELAGERLLLPVEDGEGIAVAGVVVASRRLKLPVRPWAELERGTVVKLRFERVSAGGQDVAATGLPQVGDSQP